MKRVLVITYYWPPSGGAGVQRWLKFVKYLRDFGWEPVLFCPENPEYPEIDPSLQADVPTGLEVIRIPIWEPYLFYKRLLGQKKDARINAGFLSEQKKNRALENFSVWIRGNLFIPDARKFWIRPSVRFLSKYLKHRPVEAIVSTGPPHTTHCIAREVSLKLNLPWLADFRDPWTNIDFYHDLKLTRWADRKHRRMELEVLRGADRVAVISRTMADDFERIHPRSYDVITNGYDDDDVGGLPPEPDKVFSIAHIGTLVGSRNPFTLWEALQSLVAERADLAADLVIKLVGKVDITVTDSIGKYGLAGYVRKIDYMPHNEVIRCQQESQVLLLLINDTPNARLILTGKFFEYLASRRPILCLGPVDGDAAQILHETQSGLLAGFGDVETMKSHILHFYKAYKQGELEERRGEIGQYSRRSLTGKLAGLLDRMAIKGK